MSKYILKIVTKGSEKTMQLSRGNTKYIQAEESTQYQIFNEQGELGT
ncbi:hypothetical protein [Mannheimia varigena]|nr:hypothetical protein [Mannheimia varigena]QLD34203.1 hypothetical protein A6B42_10790 [Mannheimia varigena]